MNNAQVYGIVSIDGTRKLGTAAFRIRTGGRSGISTFQERVETESFVARCEGTLNRGDFIEFRFEHRSKSHRTTLRIYAKREREGWKLQRSKLGWKWPEDLPIPTDAGFYFPLSAFLSIDAAGRSMVYDALRNRVLDLQRNATASSLTLELKPRETISKEILDEFILKEGDSFELYPRAIEYPRGRHRLQLIHDPKVRWRHERVALPKGRILRPTRARKGVALSVRSFDGCNIAGQLDRASAGRKNLLAVLLHGSGPENRDSGSGPEGRDYARSPIALFSDLSTIFTRNGVDVFRFDKRGVGKSQGHWNQTDRETQLADIACIARRLHRCFPKHRMLLVGFSEGANFAATLATRIPEVVSGVILAGGPADALDRVMIEKMKFKASQADSISAKYMNDAIRRWKSVFRSLRAMHPDTQESRTLFQGYPLSWWIQMLGHRPLDDATRIRIPTLLLHGGMDSEVLASQSERWNRIASRMNRKGVTRVVFPGLNHFFARARRPLGFEYDIPTPLEPRWVQSALDWMDDIF